MNFFESRDILNSFSVLVDTREHEGEQFDKRMRDIGADYSRATLDYGDYTAQCEFPDKTTLHDTTQRIYPRFAVERKMGLDELAMCLGRERDRFTREFERAKEQNARIWLLVENASYEKIINHMYKSKLNPRAFIGSLMAFQSRYDIRVVFCAKNTSGRLIRDILYRELKELLEGMIDE